MFTSLRWQIQAIIFLAGLIVVLVGEAWKAVMGLIG